MRIALVARYHRKVVPKPGHEDFAALSKEDQRRVRILASYLRVGDALDRSHRQLVCKVRVSLGRDAAEINAEAPGPIEAELEAASRKGDLLASIFPGPVQYRRAWPGYLILETGVETADGRR